jgi:Patched family
MGCYAVILLQPIVKVMVVVGFAGLFVACAISATKFSEEFNFKEALPRNSYVFHYANVLDESSDTGRIEPNVYFRYVDFNDTDVRQQMRAYIKDLAESPYFEGPPEVFWLDYFEWHVRSLPANMTFKEQIQDFLSVKIYNDLFGQSISMNNESDVIASRVRMRMVVDTEDTKDQLRAFKEQERISKAQPINQDRPDDLAFFCYDGVYLFLTSNGWELE